MKRGFARLTPEERKALASKGGKVAHESGTAHEFTSEAGRVAGQAGGRAVSQDREHMRRIGTLGGQKISEDWKHMQEIGRKGGKARATKKSDLAT